MAFKLNKMHIAGAVALICVIAVAFVLLGGAFLPVVQAGDTIQVNYTGMFTNGTVFGSSHGGEPLNFTVGSGEMIQGFNNAVVGMKLHQSKTVTIPVDEGYGPVNESLIVHVAKANFGNESISVGEGVTETTNGNEARGIVTAINATNVTVDFNSPLAGQILVFNITVVGIQKA